ncbi:MAG TPA: hypothetical protein VJ901_07280 [Thermoanaerobaculia bacterium]|nr:hypothetical protein [Thermoanaerobaculia bacterium]
MLILLTCSAAALSQPQALTPAPTHDQKVIRRWTLEGDPHGIAVGRDGTIYVGLAQPQAVIAVDPKTGAIKNRLVLDSPDIASTKELVTLRTSADGSLLYIANGSDESASILGLPDFKVIREITIEGEPIRDALPDPSGRFLFLLGRHVHVYDARGEKELRTIPFADPMAIAVTSDGSTLAVIGPENYGGTKATAVALYDTPTFNEITRDPMQTDKQIESAMFGANDQALLAFSRDALFEKPLVTGAAKQMSSNGDGKMRISIDFGDLVSSEKICLPEGSGPQIGTMASADLLLYAERRCSASGSTFSASKRKVTPASLYGVNAYAVAYDRDANALAVTDRAGYLTIYKVPKAASAK